MLEAGAAASRALARCDCERFRVNRPLSTPVVAHAGQDMIVTFRL